MSFPYCSRALNVAISALFAFASLCGVASAGAQTARPNFLVITSEDMSPNLGCYGDDYAITPHLDALAERGVRYSAAYANGPICSPARSALFFSMYQTSLGTSNHRSHVMTPPDLHGFAWYLRQAGYYCTNHPKADYNTLDSWKTEHATYDQGKDWRDERRQGRPFLSIINIEVTHQSRTSVWPYEKFVEQVRSKLRSEDIHDPREAVVPPYFPDTLAVRRELARYADCVTLMDQLVDEILTRLSEDGLADDTIVIYFSDHGAGHPRHKSTPYNSGLQVPFIVYCPSQYQSLLKTQVGGVCGDVVMFCDLGPTLLDIAGVEIPSHMLGVPFMGPHAAKRELAFCALDRREESFNHVRTVTDGHYLYMRNYMPHIPLGQPKGYGYPSAIYQEIKRLHEAGQLTGAAAAYMQSPQPIEQLFDLSNDPYETKNLASDPNHAATLERLRAAHFEQIRQYTDLGLVPEYELDARAAGGPVIELARRPDMLPLAEIYAAADLVGRGPDVLAQQLALMDHADSVVRWWALIGLRNQENKHALIGPAIQKALRDASPFVCIEAAAELLTHDRQHQAARQELLRHITSENIHLALYAARTSQMLRLNNDEFLDAIRVAKQNFKRHAFNVICAALERQRSGEE